jgi:LPS-assembly protein
MKNRYLIFLLYIFLFISSSVYGDEITFETEEIQIIDDGNTIITSKGLARSSDDNIEIIANRFNYNKSQLLLKAIGNGLARLMDDNIEVEADIFNYDRKTLILKATGNVKVKDLDSNILLSSNEIIYDIQSKSIKSESDSQVEDENKNLFLSKSFIFLLKENLIKLNDLEAIDNQKNVLKTDKAFINTVSKKLIGKDISIDFNNKTFQKDNEPRLKGNSVRSDSNLTVIKKGVFTSCKRNDDCPPWQLSAKEIKHDKEKKTIYYKDAWLKLYDKPVFYFPKFFHPDPTVKRQSGFLMPTFQDSSNLGGSFLLPYYHVLAENKDFTLTPRLYSEDRLTLQSEYRQVNLGSEHNLDFSFTGEKDESIKNHFFYKSLSKLNFSYFEESDVDIQLQHVTNDTYLKTYKFESPLIDDFDNLTSSIKIQANNDDLFLNLDFNVYEDLSKTKSDRFEYVLPSYNLFKVFEPNESLNGSFSINSLGYVKTYNTNVSESVNINDLNFNSNFTFSNLGIRNGYNILFKNVNSESNNSTNFKDTPNQELFSMLEFNSTYPLKKKLDYSSNILKPALSFRYSPNNFRESRESESRIDTSNIFSLNRLGRNDVVESGASITYGIEYEKTDLDDLNLFSAKLASVVRAKEEKNLPTNSSLGKKNSDIFGSLNYIPNEFFKTGYDFALKNNLEDKNYEILKGQLSINNFVTSFEYLNENNTAGKESFISNKTTYQVNSSNNLSFVTRRNKKTKLTEFYNLIYQYENDCLKAAIEYNKDYYSDRDLKPTENIFLKLTIIPFGETNSPNLKK